MKFTAVEEYGLRCALQVARRAARQTVGQSASRDEDMVTIPEIAAREGLTTANVAKIMRILLKGGIVQSTRGHQGGYRLTRPADETSVAEVMDALGGGLFPEGFCTDHRGARVSCVHSRDCALRPMWASLDAIIRETLDRVTLHDLLAPDGRAGELIRLGTAEPQAREAVPMRDA